MNKKNIPFIHIGFSTILMVFLTICLLTFASLSVLTANSDLNLSRKTAEKTSAYYQADAVSRDFVQKIDTVLSNTFHSAVNENAYYTAAESELGLLISSDAVDDMIQGCLITTSDDGVYISWQVPLSLVQYLSVTLRVHFPENDTEHFFTTIRWQTTTTNEPEDTTLPLFNS